MLLSSTDEIKRWSRPTGWTHRTRGDRVGPVDSLEAFSTSYSEARRRFREASERLGLKLSSYPVADQNDDHCSPLTIDVAIGGNEKAESAVVVSSGLHGAEGYLGSAVQMAMLEGEMGAFRSDSDVRIVLLHALNPFGYVTNRRTNGDNVDLNRNFLLPSEPYEGSPELYPKIDRWLNPASAPSRFWPVPASMVLDVLRFGLGPLINTIPVGQHEFPKGLFYGGREAAPEARIVQEHLEEWVGSADRIMHLDIHTGLGPFSKVQLLMGLTADDPGARWMVKAFGSDNVRTLPSA